MKMQTKLLGSLVLSSLLIVGFTGCGSDDDTIAVALPTATTPLSSDQTSIQALEVASAAAIAESLVG